MNLLKENPYFFTATILDWKPLLVADEFKDIVMSSLAYLASTKRAKIYAFVIMNNHIHLIWQPINKYTYQENQLSFMKYTAQIMLKELRSHNPETLKCYQVNAKDRKHQIWQRNPLSVELFTTKVMEQKLDYIHMNPVKSRLCMLPEEYHYSSASFYENNDPKWSFISNLHE